MSRGPWRSIGVLLALSACRGAREARALPAGAEAWSLAGEALFPPPLAEDERARREDLLAQARADFEARPHDADAAIWLGRRLANLGRFREAIEVFTLGIEEHPGDARMYRHRGHRWITLREFARAIPDLERAAELLAGKPDEVEPDSVPNKAGEPLETLDGNVYYHLGLARYLLGRFEDARAAYAECRRFASNADNLCSATYWLCMTLRRLGRADEARAALEPIRADLPVREYHAYHELCLAYAGERDMEQLYSGAKAGGTETVDFATVAYGVGNWHLCNGRRERALEIFREVEAGPQWHAFGHIASEAELARLGAPGGP